MEVVNIYLKSSTFKCIHIFRFMSLQLPSKNGLQTAQLQIVLPPGYQDEDKIAFPTVFQM
jgi:hypothetical protein